MGSYRRSKISEHDLEHLAYILNNRYTIRDRDTFNDAYYDYVNDKAPQLHGYEERCFQHFLTTHDIPVSKRREVVRNTIETEKTKELKKYEKGEIPPKRIREETPKKKWSYDYIGKVKGKTVYARRITYQVNVKKKVSSKKVKKGTVTKYKIIKVKKVGYIDRKGRRVKKL